MRLAKGMLMGIGALALVASMMTLVAPKAVRAAAAALVQVTNTMANAVPTSDAGFAAEPFEWEGFGNTGPVLSANFTAPSTANDGRVVQRLVIEQVTASCQGTLAPAIRVSAVPDAFSAAGSSLGAHPEFFIPFPPSPVANQQGLSQPTRIYVDPGVTVFMNLVSFGNGSCAFSAFGHLIVQ
jgi:hypothetical protein